MFFSNETGIYFQETDSQREKGTCLPQVVLAAVQRGNGRALADASEELRGDREMVLEAASRPLSEKKRTSSTSTLRALIYLIKQIYH